MTFLKELLADFSALNTKFKTFIVCLLLLGTLIRFVNLFNLGFVFDTVHTQYIWGKAGFEMGIPEFWRNYRGFFDYWPGSLYLLTFLYWISHLFGSDEVSFVIVLKIFNWFWEILFILLTMYGAKKYGSWNALQYIVLGSVVYLLPSIWFVGVVWGQMDTFIVSICLIIIFLLYRSLEIENHSTINNLFLAGLLWGMVIWIKLQAILLLPVLGLFFLFNLKWSSLAKFFGGFYIANLLILFIPVTTNLGRLKNVALLPFTRGDEVSNGASTLWVSLGLGNLKGSDLVSHLVPISIGKAGILLYFVLTVIFLWFLFNMHQLKEWSFTSFTKKIQTYIPINHILMFTAITTGMYFLFMTKMHSRYFHFAVLFFIVSLACTKFSKLSRWTYISIFIIQISYFLNQVTTYAYFVNEPFWVDRLNEVLSLNVLNAAAIINVICYVLIYFGFSKYLFNNRSILKS
jgi:hypothetical protein